MRRILRRTAFIATVLFIAFGTFLGYLGANSGHPKPSKGWIRLPDMPDPRGEIAAGVAGLTDCEPGSVSCGAVRIVAVGGLEGLGKAVRTVSIYDPVAQEWKNGPELPAARHHVGVASVGGVLFVTGGAKTATNWDPTNDFWSLKADGSGWADGAPMPEGRMGHQMVSIGSKLYVVGGRGKTSNVLIYDTLTNAWTLGAQMPQPRDHLAVTVVGSRIFAVGGRDAKLTTRVDVYDTVKDAWSEGPPLPKPMSGMAIGTLRDGIHVVGGEESKTIGGHVLDLHYRLSPDTGKWEPASRALMPVHGAASVVYDGSLVIIGGARRQGALSPLGWTGLVQVYSPDALV